MPTTREIQQRLKDLGFSPGNTGPAHDGVDGDFGTKTKSALRLFQISRALPGTGELDADTLARLFPPPIASSPAADSTKIDADVAIEICSHEGLVRQAYKDSEGVLTWGFGVTNSSGHRVERYIGNPATIERCVEIYLWLLEQKYAPAVRKVFAGHAITKAQFGAALSFQWNTGRISTASWPKLWLKGDLAGAKASFMTWTKPASLTERRQKERDLFFDGRWSSDGTCTEWTRLTSGMKPDWSSGKKVDLRGPVAGALATSASAS